MKFVFLGWFNPTSLGWFIRPRWVVFYRYNHYLTLNAERIDEDTVIAGDLNTSPVLDTRRTEKTHMDMVRFLADKGLHSAYHWQTKEEHGCETVSTFYLYRDPAKSYHFDYCFLSPSRLLRFEIGSVETWMGKRNAVGSDHLPLIIDIEE